MYDDHVAFDEDTNRLLWNGDGSSFEDVVGRMYYQPPRFAVTFNDRSIEFWDWRAVVGAGTHRYFKTKSLSPGSNVN